MVTQIGFTFPDADMGGGSSTKSEAAEERREVLEQIKSVRRMSAADAGAAAAAASAAAGDGGAPMWFFDAGWEDALEIAAADEADDRAAEAEAATEAGRVAANLAQFEQQAANPNTAARTKSADVAPRKNSQAPPSSSTGRRHDRPPLPAPLCCPRLVRR